jgi:hypothetical protein
LSRQTAVAIEARFGQLREDPSLANPARPYRQPAAHKSLPKLSGWQDIERADKMARRAAGLESDGTGGTVNIALQLVNQRILAYQEPPDCPEALDLQVVGNQQPGLIQDRSNGLFRHVTGLC